MLLDLEEDGGLSVYMVYYVANIPGTRKLKCIQQIQHMLLDKPAEEQLHTFTTNIFYENMQDLKYK